MFKTVFTCGHQGSNAAGIDGVDLGTALQEKAYCLRISVLSGTQQRRLANKVLVIYFGVEPQKRSDDLQISTLSCGDEWRVLVIDPVKMPFVGAMSPKPWNIGSRAVM